jgi:predicted AAA+ superfamily ATPase
MQGLKFAKAMIQQKVIGELIRLDRLAKGQAKKYPTKRFLFPQLKYLLISTKQLVGIAGLRGTGKTILLRQLATELDQAFYLSADTLPIGTDFFEIASPFEESMGIKYLMVDEIHALKECRVS